MGIGIVPRGNFGLFMFLPFFLFTHYCSRISCFNESYVLWQLDDAHCEGDSQLLINAINREAECEAWYGHLVEEAKQTFKNRPQWSISFVHKQGNCAAHRLAQYGLNLYEEQVWVEETPDVSEEHSNIWNSALLCYPKKEKRKRDCCWNHVLGAAYMVVLVKGR